MPQPYDYTSKVPSPFEAFSEALKLGQQGQQIRLQREKAQAEQDERTRFSEAMSRLGPGATYEDYVEAVKASPRFADTITQTWKSGNEAKNRALFDAGANAWNLLRPGEDGRVDPKAASDKLEEAALAFENSGDRATAAQLRANVKAINLDPAKAQGAIGFLLTVTDPDKAKAVMGRADDTGFQKEYEYILETFGPESAEQFKQSKLDPVVSIPLPGGRTYFGPRSGMAAQVGAGGDVVIVKTIEEARALPPGTRFKGADGVVRVR